MNWDWNGIRHFVTLVECQTLTAAAERLNVQHSTVARQIRQLEAALGLRLFDRVGKRYHLSAAGERLYHHAGELYKDMQGLERLAREQRERHHRVVISAPPFVVRQLLLPRLGAFYRQHRHIRLILQAEATLADLHGRQADIALRLVRPTRPDLTVRRLHRFSYRVYGQRDYLRQTRRAAWQFVQIAVPTAFARWFNDLIGNEADVVLASNDFAAVKQALSARLGVGLLPDFAVGPEDGLQPVALAPGAEAFPAEIYLVMHEDVRRSPSVRAVADFLAEVLRSDES